MSCNNKHDFPFATTVVGEVKDSFMASVGFENGKYLKLGNCVFNSSVKNTKHLKSSVSEAL